MTSNPDLMPDLDSEDAFEVQMRGYSRRQVDEFVAKSRSQIRDLEERLSRTLDEMERLRHELATARQDLAHKPAHEEISERVGQILKLADEEAKAQHARAQDEIARLREQAKKEIDRFRTEAREQTERMLTAAQEQAENAIASARAEAEKMRNSARIESERAINEATKEAENSLASAKAQAKQLLDEATMRASAIHDGADRRLTLLTTRHTETMRRLTEIRDVVTNLVASEVARGSLEEEVAKSVAKTAAASGTGAQVPPRAAAPADPRHIQPEVRPSPAGPGRPGGRDLTVARDRGTPDPARPSTGHLAPHAAAEERRRQGAPMGEDRVVGTARATRSPAGSPGGSPGVAGPGGTPANQAGQASQANQSSPANQAGQASQGGSPADQNSPNGPAGGGPNGPAGGGPRRPGGTTDTDGGRKLPD
jgi:cell division septum initiation protein DivIVA